MEALGTAEEKARTKYLQVTLSEVTAGLQQLTMSKAEMQKTIRTLNREVDHLKTEIQPLHKRNQIMRQQIVELTQKLEINIEMKAIDILSRRNDVSQLLYHKTKRQLVAQGK